MNDSDRSSLRSLLLKRRDTTSADLLKISSKAIRNKLGRIKPYRDAACVGAYHPVGSEILTQEIMQGLLSAGRKVCLPKISGQDMEFRQILDFSDLETGSFGILEPKDACPVEESLDVILVPTVGISPDGVRLGYGHGYYDRFLAGCSAVTISLTLEKQVIRKIPRSQHDVLMDWIVTEERVVKTQR